MTGRGNGRVPIWARESTAFRKVSGTARRRGPSWKLAVLNIVGLALAAAGVATSFYWNRGYTPAAGNWSPPLLPLLFLAGGLMVLVLWKLPVIQVSRSNALTDEKRFDRENEARKTLAQILAGAFVLAGLYSSVQTFNLSHEGQITDRFTKAIDQLGALDGAGNPKLEVRLGGIYALERIARDSERDHPAIMEVLTAYVREHSPLKDKKTWSVTEKDEGALELTQSLHRLPTDIQTILTVLARRKSNYDRGPLNLEKTDLNAAKLQNADMRGWDLDGAELVGADLRGANLSGASLFAANLVGTDLTGATVTGARLRLADLTLAHAPKVDFAGLDLVRVNFRFADLNEARFAQANLRWVNFEWAELNHAIFGRADLIVADFKGASLDGAQLSEVSHLTQKQVDSASGDEQTVLPGALRKPQAWTQ